MMGIVMDMAGTILIMAGIATGTIAACRIMFTARFSSSGSCAMRSTSEEASLARALRLLARARIDTRIWEDAL